MSHESESPQFTDDGVSSVDAVPDTAQFADLESDQLSSPDKSSRRPFSLKCIISSHLMLLGLAVILLLIIGTNWWF